MDYPYAKFDDFNFIRFGFIMRTIRQTESQTNDRLTHATTVDVSEATKTDGVIWQSLSVSEYALGVIIFNSTVWLKSQSCHQIRLYVGLVRKRVGICIDDWQSAGRSQVDGVGTRNKNCLWRLAPVEAYISTAVCAVDVCRSGVFDADVAMSSSAQLRKVRPSYLYYSIFDNIRKNRRLRKYTTTTTTLLWLSPSSCIGKVWSESSNFLLQSLWRTKKHTQNNKTNTCANYVCFCIAVYTDQEAVDRT